MTLFVLFKLLPFLLPLPLLRLLFPCKRSLQIRGHKSTRPGTKPKRPGRSKKIQIQNRIPIPSHHQKGPSGQGCHHCRHRHRCHQRCHHHRHHRQVHQRCHRHRNQELLQNQECHHRHHHCLRYRGYHHHQSQHPLPHQRHHHRHRHHPERRQCHHHRCHYQEHQECHHCHRHCR